MIKKKKKKTLLNHSGSSCHKEMFIDGHIFGWERLRVVIIDLGLIPLTDCGLTRDTNYMYVIY